MLFFEELNQDFNGDIFSISDEEKEIISLEHLQLLKQFLLGDIKKRKLFFWAYRFDIIPIEVISTIYEEFYHYKSKDNPEVFDDNGTHYTPLPLVEFVLSRLLNYETLSRRPRILDPACGSGIFLVESFRRLVRYEMISKGVKALECEDLLNILRTQILGIELNEEATKIAAFSLYLAYLHYQEPPDILAQIENEKQLPYLIVAEEKKPEKVYFDILLNSNTFDIGSSISNEDLQKKFSQESADILVGNPPWGQPSSKDTEGRLALEPMIDWCNAQKLPISDNERSQGFIWKSVEMLKGGGQAGLLVSSGVLLKHSQKSIDFKTTWLQSIKLLEVINFIHVRDVFFGKAISPFLFIKFRKAPPSPQDSLRYWTIRRTETIANSQFIIIDKSDFKYLFYRDLNFPGIFKIFWFGNHLDYSLINGLSLYPPLKTFINHQSTGRGFQNRK